MKIQTAIVAICIVGASVAVAQEQAPAATGSTKTPVVTKRQENQHARIRQGVKSGELTKGEAAKLRSEQRAIKAEKQMAKADGNVTPEERAKLHKDQNKASRDIYRMKHNNKARPGTK